MPALLPALALIVPLAFGSPAEPTDAARAEVLRIQRHFDGALALLAARDVSSLTSEQRARRTALTGVLRAYRDRGLFPRNYDFPGEAIPYFIDRRTGVLCAVAHLMESTGRRDLVEAVANADNNVWVPELAGNAEFRGWLDANGLTLEEAARIQVPYVGDPLPQTVLDEANPSSNMLGATVASLGTITMSEIFPEMKSNRAGALLSFAAGTFATTTAARAFDRGADPRVAGLILGAGLVNYYYSGRSYSRYRSAERERRTTISPIIPAAREQGAGIMLSLTF